MYSFCFFTGSCRNWWWRLGKKRMVQCLQRQLSAICCGTNLSFGETFFRDSAIPWRFTSSLCKYRFLLWREIQISWKIWIEVNNCAPKLHPRLCRIVRFFSVPYLEKIYIVNMILNIHILWPFIKIFKCNKIYDLFYRNKFLDELFWLS